MNKKGEQQTEQKQTKRKTKTDKNHVFDKNILSGEYFSGTKRG